MDRRKLRGAAMTAPLVCVGAFAGAHGVRGDVRLKSFCAVPEDIAKYSPFSSEDGKQTFDLKITKTIKNGFAARVKGVTQRDAAEALKGTRLYVPRDCLPELPDDEFYHSDLIGLEVIDTGGALLGKITAVHDHGAGDMLDVRLKGGSKSVLLPFTKEAVPTVDLTAGRVIVDMPEGLLDG